MEVLPQIFAESFASATATRRNVIQTKKLLLESIKRGDHESFCESFKDCVLVILTAKKGLTGVDKVLKFIRAFFDVCYGTCLANYRGLITDQASPQHSQLSPVASFLAEFLIFHLAKGFLAKDKIVRFRVCQLMGFFLELLDEVEDDLLNGVVGQLYKRTFDKEANVRAHALISLTVVLESLEDSDMKKIINRFVELLNHDPASEVRKAALWNIPLTTTTINQLVSRSRDTDALIRKSVYLRFMSEDNLTLTPEHKNILLKNGLFDRDYNVKKACLKFLCEKWIGDVNVFDLLEKVDVIDPTCTEAAVKSYFLAKDVSISFDEATWSQLTPNTSFLFRAYISYCHENKLLDKLEEILPPIPIHLKLLQKHAEIIVNEQPADDDTTDDEFIFGQLLLMCLYQDYSDELSRRNTLNLLRTYIAQLDLPIEVLEACIKSIKTCSVSERDFAMIIIEVLTDCYEPSPEMTVDQACALLKCLEIITLLFKHTEKAFKGDNVMLQNILDTYVIPGIKANNEALGEAALNCLGLSFLLDKDTMKKKLIVFTHAFRTNKHELQKISLRVLFDVVSYYGWEVDKYEVQGIFKKALESTSEEVLGICVEGLTKLFLFGYYDDVEVLQVLIISYFHPVTINYLRLRQCLTYFFNAYCFSQFRNMNLIKECLMPCFQFLKDVPEVEMKSTVMQFGEWCDVRRLVKSQEHENLHVIIAQDILKEIRSISVDDTGYTRVLCQFLASLWLGEVDDETETEIRNSVQEVKHQISDTVASNALKKFIGAIQDTKKIEKGVRDLKL